MKNYSPRALKNNIIALKIFKYTIPIIIFLILLLCVVFPPIILVVIILILLEKYTINSIKQMEIKLNEIKETEKELNNKEYEKIEIEVQNTDEKVLKKYINDDLWINLVPYQKNTKMKVYVYKLSDYNQIPIGDIDYIEEKIFFPTIKIEEIVDDNTGLYVYKAFLHVSKEK